MADNVSFFDGCPVFDVVIHGEVYAHVELKIPGKHNILNTLGSGRRQRMCWVCPARRYPVGWRPSTAQAAAWSTRGHITGGGLRRLRPPSR